MTASADATAPRCARARRVRLCERAAGAGGQGAGRPVVRTEDGVDSPPRGSAHAARSGAGAPPPPPPPARRARPEGRCRSPRRRPAAAAGSDSAADRRRSAHPAARRAGDRARRRSPKACRRCSACWPIPILKCGRWRRSRSACSATPGRARPLVAALGDPSPLVQGSAAEALGLLGDAAVGRRGRRVRRARSSQSRRARAAARRSRRCPARHADGGVSSGHLGAGAPEGVPAAGRGGARRRRSAARALVAGRVRAAAARGQAGAARAADARQGARTRTRGPSR